MEYPNELITFVKKRAQYFDLQGFVAGQGPLSPKLMIVGEAPGRKEIENFIPFSGQAGKELMACLANVGLTRADVYITSAVRSRPYAVKEHFNKKTGAKEIIYPNRTPSKKEVLAHAPILDYEIEKIAPKLITPVGNIGLQRLLGNSYFVTRCHGQIIQHPIQKLNENGDGYIWTEENYTIVPLFHPAAIFYNRKLESLIQADWQVIGDLLHAT
ncbi:uracil-DNA glycosylase [Enterococcus dispar]|uniref:uracil-DNA glycosylase n=1 Tax=Enterococcus dispar TaxID=44009 RepID=UPI002490A7F9|nr:uracil-DNA glycosylase [Enterococcus dispar]